MKLDFDAMEVTTIPAFKGGEGAISAAMQVDSLNKIMKATLPKGSTVGLHTHETSSEIIIGISGEADHIVDGVLEKLTPGTAVYCPKGHSHTLITTSAEPLVFYAVVPEQ